MRLNKILTIPIALMMLLAVTAVPTMACSPLAPCNAKSNSGMGSNINVVETKLIGQDAAKLTSEASGNSDVKSLTEILATRGYAMNKSSPMLANKLELTNGMNITEMQFVTIPFDSKPGVKAYIIWMDDNGKETAQAAISGPASAITKPMELLKANDTFRQIENNLTHQGYTIDEKNATVNEGLSTSADVALITINKVNATGTTTGILALVDLSQNKVIGVMSSQSFQCDACVWIATRVCNWGLGGTIGCIDGCGELCATLILDPPLAAFCWASCSIICLVAISVGCSWGATYICTQAGFC
jgi:halocin C8-like bacteriocin domain-containing protein